MISDLLFRKWILFLVALFTFSLVTSAAIAQTIVSVTDTRDLVTPTAPNRDTCAYTEGSGAITRAAPDGICTFRRAINEATARPTSDRPITIVFNIPTGDSNYDSGLQIWEVQVDETYPLELTRLNTLSRDGRVIIDGNSQMGGRNIGPKIMINTNRDNLATGGRSLEVRTTDNEFRNLGFHGGGQIILYNASNTVDSIWMGLSNDGLTMELASDATEQAKRSMARGGIIMPSGDSDSNTITNNRIIGAFERAIRVTSGGQSNVISNNFIGMNALGEVDIPLSGLDCIRAVNYLPQLWYGGEGIQVTGNNNTISANTFAGLHRAQSTNDTPPIAMEIAGLGNQIELNQVGTTEAGDMIGVCGQGLLLQGTQSIATQNSFIRTKNGFDPGDIGNDFDSAIITQSFTTGAGQWLEVFDNVIDGLDEDDSNFHGYRFAGPGVPETLRRFVPAKITQINGVDVKGTIGDPLPMGPPTECPDCTIYLYLDDDDDRIEAKNLIATTVADAGGNWTATLPAPLKSGESLRTQSQTNGFNVIGNFGPRTTSRLSDDAYVPDEELCVPIRASNNNIAVVCL